MSRVQCLTCDGVYDTTTDEGQPYHHACPPLRGVKITRPLVGIIIVPPEDVEATDTVIVDVVVPRKGARNENIDLSTTKKDGSHPIVSAGLGVKPLPAPAEVPLVGFPE